jgi:hypothetical protein
MGKASLTVVRILGSYQVRKGPWRPLLGSPVDRTRFRVFHELDKIPILIAFLFPALLNLGSPTPYLSFYPRLQCVPGDCKGS